jgi:hypothetical protein
MRQKLFLIMFFSIIVITAILIISNSVHAIGAHECMCQSYECHILMETACSQASYGTGEVLAYNARYACCRGGTWCETGYGLICATETSYYYSACTCECNDPRCDPW